MTWIDANTPMMVLTSTLSLISQKKKKNEFENFTFRYGRERKIEWA